MHPIASSIIVNILNPAIKFLFALAVLYFLYGVAKFIMSQNSEEGKTIGKSHMLWGTIGLTIMMGVWFFLNLIIRTFNIDYIEIRNNNNEAEIEITI